MSAVSLPPSARPVSRAVILARLDAPLLLAALALLALGLIMVASASMPLADHQFNDPFRYFRRQLIYALLGLGLGALVLRLSLERLQPLGFTLMAISFALLLVVLVPGWARWSTAAPAGWIWGYSGSRCPSPRGSVC